MSVDKEKIEALLSQLPEDLQHEVLAFAETLVHRSAHAATNGTQSVRTLFGAWDSGDPQSADNDRIDVDLARESASPHNPEQ